MKTLLCLAYALVLQQTKKNNLMIKIKLLIAFIILGFAQIAHSTKISGTISDATNKELLVGVTIMVYSANDANKIMITGTSSDLDGNYELDIIQGNYIVSISYVSYNSEEISLNITSNETITKNIELQEASFILESVEVIATVSRYSEGILMMERKNASTIEEKIGSKELSRKAASDAASGVKKISGVSMMGSKNLFVRGLGDRFNSAQLNGLPIASPDPNKKIIKLDIFQTDIIDNLSVNKAYDASNYADYTGALIDISTKDFPEEGFLSFSIGSKYNSELNDFKQIDAKGNRYFGLGTSARQDLTPSKYLIAKRKTQVIGNDFNPASFGYSDSQASPFLDISVSGGKLFQLNEKRKLGGTFSISFNNEYETLLGVKELQINKQNITDGNFTSDSYSYNTNLTGLGSLTYIHNPNHSIRYNTLFINSGNDVYKEKTGTKPDWKNGEETALIRNAQFINYNLLSNHLVGKHKMLDQSLLLQWDASYAQINYHMPDRREVVYWTQQAMNEPMGVKEWGFMTYDKGLATKRLISNQTTNDINAALDIKYIINEKSNINIGGETRSQFLDYRSFFYGYSFEAGQAGNLTLPVDINSPNDFFGSEYLENVKNNSSDQMGYDAQSSIYAAFITYQHIIGNQLTINAGLRMENSSMDFTPGMNVNDGNEETIEIKNTDLFPALNVKWAVQEKMNIRFAASRTVTKPSFFEKSPALIIPEQGENRFIGNIGTKDNPNDFGYYLENSYSQNAELKWEWFPSSSEVISLAAYGKIINEPIENISYIQGGTDRTYSVRNFSDKANVAGAELELKKKFGNFFTGLNLAYIYTHIEVPANANELNDTRSLQGASPYLINADIGYELNYGAQQSKRSYIGLIYSVFGKRIFVVGINEGNQYQLPFNSLDMVLKNKLSERLSIDLSFKNLLNSKYSIVQDVYTDSENPELKTNEILIKEYKTGIDFSITLKYKI